MLWHRDRTYHGPLFYWKGEIGVVPSEAYYLHRLLAIGEVVAVFQSSFETICLRERNKVD